MRNVRIDEYKRTRSMSKPTKIKELTSHKVSQLLTDKKFSKLKPSNCGQCGEEKRFSRRIFEVNREAKSKHSDDKTQDYIRLQFKQRYSIDFIFFKIHEGRFLLIAQCMTTVNRQQLYMILTCLIWI